MTRKNVLKINQLLRIAPKDMILTNAWLKEQEISNKLAWWYVKAGWFEHIADGAYCLAGSTLTWASAIASIQQQLGLPIYPGGKTALQLLGKGHYINMDMQAIQLFTSQKIKLPRWLQAPSWKESFILYRPALFNSINEATLTSFEVDGQRLIISTPERAAVELCYLVPNVVTFKEAALIIEGLPRMRSKLIQWLLENCLSHKAKRILLYLAEYFNHPWLSEINFNHIDLGKGKRVIAGGGQYSAKYRISVPTLEDNQ